MPLPLNRQIVPLPFIGLAFPLDLAAYFYPGLKSGELNPHVVQRTVGESHSRRQGQSVFTNIECDAVVRPVQIYEDR